MRLLILTDHGGHTVNNSLYAIARAMATDERMTEVRVASRSTPANAAWFACAPDVDADLRTLTADEDFSFETAATGFSASESLFPTPVSWPDAVFLRIPHPVPETWFVHLRKTFGARPILNAPEGIETTTSKAWLLNVPELCAPMRLCRTAREVAAFGKTRDAVLKPLRGYGGQGIVRVRDGRVELPTGQVSVTDYEPPAPVLAVEYTRRVSEGDKRIVVVGGEVLGAVLRVPAAGAWLCNVSQGGHAEPATLTPGDARIAKVLDAHMRRLGVVMYGIDTLADNDGRRVLSEVNTMSIGGLLDLPPVGGQVAPARAARLLISALLTPSPALLGRS